MANKEFKFSNYVKNVTGQCKVVVYPWANGLNNPDMSDEDLSKAGRLDISSQVMSVSYTKPMGSPAGSFTIELSNSPGIGSNDWKDIIKRGYWLVIYMSQDGDLITNPEVGPNLSKNRLQESKRIRCIGYVDRVPVRATTLENRALDITFRISGRDFGCVYESTNVWHNLFNYEQILIQSVKTSDLNVTGNIRVHKAFETIHNLFFYPMKLPGAKVNDRKSLLEIGLQWLMPRPLLQDLGFSGLKDTYWGNIPGVMDISPTGAGLAIANPTDYLSGNAWEQLKKLSIPQYHEVFTETRDDGKPRIVFRPIPWGIDQSKYPDNAPHIKLYKDLSPVCQVPAVDVYDWELAEDDHSRYNSFLATVQTTLIGIEDNVSLLQGTEFPKHNRASIRRHGFRPMHIQVDSIVKNEQLANGSADYVQLLEFNHILYDYWNLAIYAESGTVSKTGSNDVKIGKVMKFNDDVPYINRKRYYIEGYTDTFTMLENGVGMWNQDVVLTRGFEEEDLKRRSGFAQRGSEFISAGEYTKRNSGK